MSAERNALDAALSFSANLEEQIKRLKKSIQECSNENRLLRNKLEHVKDAVHERGRPEPDFQGQSCEASVPHEVVNQCADNITKAPYNRCKNCGAIV